MGPLDRLSPDLEKGYDTILEKHRERPIGQVGRPKVEDDHGLGCNWMSQLDDDLPMSALTLPGTHDSAAFTRQWPFIATQRMNILQQLTSGIRYFDLRCGIRDDIAEMVHGPSVLDLTLSDVLSTMYMWLESNPTEGLIVQIKEDREPERSTVHFSQAIFSHISADSERWRTANTTPSLGELRGKIQLFRRFRARNLFAYGIDVTQWQDNPSRPFTISTRHDVQLTIQDHYSFSDPIPLPTLIATKGGDVSGLLNRASAVKDETHWYMNFTSAYEFNLYYQLPPREVAIGGYNLFRWEEGMNPRLQAYLLEHEGKHRYGIVAMDFPDVGSEDLISLLVKSNFAPKDKARHIYPVCLLLLSLMLWMLAMVRTDFSIEETLRIWDSNHG
ncbi:1-phosphatidylinositol phosphodiesterase [Lecanosticta acicola]|uniref:1-phosphatidylinositol phosphodiesterase n=1 Tax=Lecanosticta acicola TaxID=111012 RepID=A0AAI9EDN3_9PEZI|nr:1-phosphatidylinositol phosphodiesterase [Lecanosticta acicola]